MSNTCTSLSDIYIYIYICFIKLLHLNFLIYIFHGLGIIVVYIFCFFLEIDLTVLGYPNDTPVIAPARRLPPYVEAELGNESQHLKLGYRM